MMDMYMMPMYFWSSPEVTAYLFTGWSSKSEGTYFGYLVLILAMSIALEALNWFRNSLHVRMYNETIK